MRWSTAHIPTLRQAPQEAEIVSHQLMIRAGFIRRLAGGIYSYLPLGWRVLLKLENIIRDEMDIAGAQEVLLPFVQPKELWEETGRWGVYGKELGRFKDRHENDYCLQPTSEEVITDLVRRDVRSYRQLPLNLYQIQTKFRDEIRPRFGVMRSREFIMKDAYSFDLDEASAMKSYEVMRRTYRRIFTRSGLKFKPVVADTGAIGGNRSEEFTVLADSGEDEIVSCSACDYGANQEKAEGIVALPVSPADVSTQSVIETPGIKTIEQLATSLKVAAKDLLKTMIATDSSGTCIVVLIRGDHELHELKLQNLVGPKKGLQGIRLATDDELRQWKLPKGSLGPVDFPRDALVVADTAISMDVPYVCGANIEGRHLKDIVLSRDARVDIRGTIRKITNDEACSVCGKPLQILRGIEVGHVFYLGTKYSKAMKLEVTLESGKNELMEMGCYGIGVGRTIAACIEQNHDKDGIIWPLAMAPYSVGIVTLGEGRQVQESHELYMKLRDLGIDAIWDDRPVSPGVKLKDMDLIGIPFQVVIGDRGLQREIVEWKRRGVNEKVEVPVGQILQHILAVLKDEKLKVQNQLEALK